MTFHYVYVFIQSNLLEVLVLLPLFGWSIGYKRTFLSVTLVNATTHPLVFFGWMHLPLTYLQDILLAETFAIVSEALLYQRFLGIAIGRATLGSLLANLVSWQLAPIGTALVFLRDRLF